LLDLRRNAERVTGLSDTALKALVRYRERRHAHRAGARIAAGFAWAAANLGGVRRHLICLAAYSQFDVTLYPSVEAARWWPAQRRAQYAASAWRRAVHHDLVHSHVEPAFVRAGMIAQDHGKPWVHTYHTLYFPEDWGGELLPWQEAINRALIDDARGADARLSVSSWCAKHLSESYGITTEVIPNGVDVHACDAARADRFVSAFEGDSGVLFVGTLGSIKNPLAFVEIARRFPAQRFVMIGANLTRDRVSQEFGGELPSNLITMGPMSGEAALDAVAACRVFVMTSHREGLPTALLEAMAMQKPCVAPRSYGCEDVIHDDRFGFLYEPGDLDDLEAKIRAALDAASVAAARERVLEHFSWDVVMPRIDAVYARLLEPISSLRPIPELARG
jgi:glycosyltransferase involved in cell wall biosynthesis